MGNCTQSAEARETSSTVMASSKMYETEAFARLSADNKNFEKIK